MKRKIVEPEDLKLATLEPREMPRPTLRQPLVLHLVEQHERDHRRPIADDRVAASIKRLIEADAS